MSIDNQVVWLKELVLLSVEESTQYSIDVTLQTIVHSNEWFMMKYKSKKFCSSSKLVGDIL
jgi:hypothetical protein